MRYHGFAISTFPENRQGNYGHRWRIHDSLGASNNMSVLESIGSFGSVQHAMDAAVIYIDTRLKKEAEAIERELHVAKKT